MIAWSFYLSPNCDKNFVGNNGVTKKNSNFVLGNRGDSLGKRCRFDKTMVRVWLADSKALAGCATAELTLI